eukprot:scaffold15000_cov143-Skeletonema_dohrnii-CCMP3373.AAC.1
MVTVKRSKPLERMSFPGWRSKSKSMAMLKYCLGVGAGIVIGRISCSSDSIGSVSRVAGPFLQDYYRSSNDNGWHDISVYFGDRNSIKEEAKSQVGQDDIISNLMSLYHRSSSSKQKKGTIRNTTTEAEVPDQMYFVDLAANDAINLSNTFKLEQMGWDGLCIEPNPVYWYRLSHRKCAVAGAFVGGKTDMQQVDVSLSNKAFGGIIGDKFDNKEEHEQTKEKRFTVSIKSLFQKFNVPQRIDYFSLDVEGAEELIMKDFPFDDYTVHFATVERPKPELQKLLKDHDYHFVMQIVNWGETLWVHGSVLKEVSLKDLKKNALETMGKDGDEEWPPSYWNEGSWYFDMETGIFHQP